MPFAHGDTNVLGPADGGINDLPVEESTETGVDRDDDHFRFRPLHFMDGHAVRQLKVMGLPFDPHQAIRVEEIHHDFSVVDALYLAQVTVNYELVADVFVLPLDHLVAY